MKSSRAPTDRQLQWSAAPLLAITDAGYSDAHMLERLEAMMKVRKGKTELQVRTGFAGDVMALVSLCARLGVPLWFNRSIVRAQTYGAGFHGSPNEVQLAKRAGVRGPFSAPVHSRDELEAACAVGVDAILVSPVFEVRGKAAPLGIGGLRQLAKGAAGRARVIALGGITPETCAQVLDVSHVDGVAAIRGAWC